MSSDATNVGTADQLSNDMVFPGETEQRPEGLNQTQKLDQQQTTESDSSPDSDGQHEQNHDGVQHRINQLTAEKYRFKRELEEAQQRLQQLEKSGQQFNSQPKPEELTAPSLPDDMFDEDAMRQYHADMLKYSQSMAQQAARSTYEQSQKTVQEQAQQQQMTATIEKYARNAIADGVDLEKLRTAEVALTHAGIKPELGTYIMNDQHGGKIATYLSDNPALMYEICSMDPVSAGIKIATEIKAKALSSTPSVSKAPAPTPEVGNGGGYVAKDDFESKYPDTEFI